MVMQMPSLIGTPTLIDSFQAHWKGIHVVDLYGHVNVFDTDPFYHTHIVNSFENGTGIVLDVGAYSTPPFDVSAVDTQAWLNKAERDSNKNRAWVRRLHFHTCGPRRGDTT